MDSSSAFSPCRIDWRPSRRLSLALAALGLLSALAVCLSALPLWCKLSGALAALAFGAWLARRELRSPVIGFVWPGGDAPATLRRSDGGEDVAAVRGVVFRAGIVAVALHSGDGRIRRLVWWPDTLTPDGRRALRLVVAAKPDKLSTLPLIGG